VKSLFRGARPVVRLLWARLLQASGCLWWAKQQLQRNGSVVVLTFHRVLDDTEFEHTCSLAGIVLRRQTFLKLAEYAVRAFEAVDFVQGLEKPADRMRVMFTFDDGWKDNYTNALPVTLAHNIPVTVFVCPGLVGRKLPFWPELVSSLLGKANPPSSAVEIESLIETLKTYTPERREKFIARLYALHASNNSNDAHTGDETVTWDDIREMDAAGVRFGCHTQTHQILTRVSAQTARQEIRDSKRAIEGALGKVCDLFAYPNGNSSKATRRMLKEEGFTAAFTTQRGAWAGGCDRMAIPRVNVCEANVAGLTGQFSPAMFEYNLIWKAWRAMKAKRRAAGKPVPERVLREALSEAGYPRQL
jgi:peptidoglycan/xylan/chitin deacetylase (PgdA/CDA1 family)